MRRKKFDPENAEGHYILIGQTVVRERNLLQWAKWFESSDRRVGLDEVADGVKVSTVFLGLDYRWTGSGDPMVFETMVFTKTKKHKQDEWGDGVIYARSSTWKEAEHHHKMAVGEMRKTHEQIGTTK